MTQNDLGTVLTEIEPAEVSAECEGSDSSRLIAEALDAADLNALRITLLQLTGDPELRDMPLDSIPIRNGRVWVTVVHPDYQARLKEIAAEYLGRSDRAVPQSPERETVLDLLANFNGGTLAEADIPMATENLAFDGFPRDLKEGLQPGVSIPDDFHVTIIGAGHTGVAMAVYLQRIGVNFTIVERQSRFGGTWVANHYPGLRVDVSGFVYQYNFAPYKWRSHFPTQAEVLEYVDFVVDRYDLTKDARLGTEVLAADWDEEARRWKVELSDGSTLSSNFVISASGLFSTANTPDIPGLPDFGGEVLHTARWNDDYDASGKTVALIGNGSSGTQLLPWLAANADKVYAFQRTPQWIVPPVNVFFEKVSPALHWLFDNLPYYQNWHNHALQVVGINGQIGHELDPEWQEKYGTLSEHNDALRANLEDYIATKLEGRPDLIEKSIPTQAPLSRRLIVDNGWYDSLMLPNVELVTTPISNIDENGISTNDGEHYGLDSIVLGSGFDVGRYFWPVTYTGQAGQTLEQVWRRDGARAYLGFNYPDFPNFFSCYGPNSHPRSGGFHVWTEAWARYVSSMIVATLNRGAEVVSVKRDAFEEYNEALDEQFKTVVWGVVPSGGYYINEKGRPGVHMPYRAQEYYDMLANPNFDHYRFSS